MVALSVATVLNFDRLMSAAAEIRGAFPETPILAGGQAFR